jgi:putative effector of murein hydrolase LrgA (UPF0299 family)
MAVEPVAAGHIMIATVAGAMVIMFGAVYALLFAWSRVKSYPKLMIGAYFSYLLFALSVAVMAYTLNLHGFWVLIVAVMLLGYLLAPHGIWYLCVGTHDNEEEKE